MRTPGEGSECWAGCLHSEELKVNMVSFSCFQDVGIVRVRPYRLDYSMGFAI